MTPNSWLEAEMARQIHDNHLAYAENRRLIALTTGSQRKTASQFRRKIGGWLIAAGQRLQPPATLQKAHEF